MGTNRERAAATTASTLSTPSEKRRFASSTSRITFEHGNADHHQNAHHAVIEKPCPAAMSAMTMPTSETGIREQHDERAGAVT